MHVSHAQVNLPTHLPEGDSEIKVKYTLTGYLDEALNANPDFVLVSNSTGKFACDSKPPTLSVTYPTQENGCITHVDLKTSCEDTHGCAVFCQMDGKKIDGSGAYGYSVAEASQSLKVHGGLHTIRCFATDTLDNVVDKDIFQFSIDCTAPEVVLSLDPDHVDKHGNTYSPNGLDVILTTKSDYTFTFSNFEAVNGQGLYANVFNADQSLKKTNSPEGSFEYTCYHNEVKHWDGDFHFP